MPAHGRPRAIGRRISGHLRSAAPASFRRLCLQRAWRRLGPESNRGVGAVRRTHLLVTRLAGQLSFKPTVRPRGLAWLLVSTAVTGVSREESQASRGSGSFRRFPALPYISASTELRKPSNLLKDWLIALAFEALGREFRNAANSFGRFRCLKNDESSSMPNSVLL